MKLFFGLLLVAIPRFVISQTNNSISSKNTPNGLLNGVNFEQSMNWDQVCKKAKAQNKYIFIDCYATWCAPCKKMDRDVYTNDSVSRYMNENYISIKLQMDSSTKDNEQIRSWYSTSHLLQTKYSINLFPTFLFFSPDDSLVHREYGYKDTSQFLTLVKDASNPLKQYNTLIKNYQKGQKDYSVMCYLATTTAELGNMTLAFEIASDYKYNFLDKKNVLEICTDENLQLINTFPLLGNSKDGFFKLYSCYGSLVDSITKFPGWAEFHLNYIVEREEIYDKLWHDDKPISLHPDWDRMQSAISIKYSNVNAEKLITIAKLDFYSRTKNWKIYTSMLNNFIELNPPNKGGGMFSVAIGGDTPGLNPDVNSDAGALNSIAWNMFQSCEDRKYLIKALEFSDISIAIMKPLVPVGYLDTKANILYKLGRTEQAIGCEEHALAIFLSQAIDRAKARGESVKTDSFKDYLDIIFKMNAHQPTWSSQ